MAEASDLPKTLQDMEKEITCAICHAHYREPKILPCFHYYCTKCLQQLASRRTGRPVFCPECRREAAFPQNDARQLPTPFFVNRLVELYGKMEKAEGRREAYCEMCSSGRAEAFCRQCAEFICTKCIESHQRMKVFASHETVSMEQLKEGGAKQISTQATPLMKCQEHNEVIKLFCFTCNDLICRDCLIDDHANHKREFVKKCAPQCRKKLKDSLVPLQQAQAKITAAVSDIRTTKREVAENLATVSDTISQSIDRLLAILPQHKKDMQAKASELAEEKLGALDAQEKSLDMLLAEAQNMGDFVEQSLASATDEELLEMQQQIVDGVEENCKRQQQVDLQPVAKANISTNMLYDQQLQEAITAVGLNAHMSCDQQAPCTVGSNVINCRAEGVESKEIEVNKPTQFTLHVVDTTCYPHRHLPTIVAEVKSLVDKSIVSATITSVSDKLHRVTYTPQIRGRHCITVSVNGKEISSSPFSVFVRIPLAQFRQPVRKIDDVKSPFGIAIGNNDELLVAEYRCARVSVFDKDGRKLRTIQHKSIPEPIGVTTDPDGNIYISNTEYTIVKLDKDGQTLKVAKNESDDIYFIRVISGFLFVCCGNIHSIVIYDCDTLQLIQRFGSRGVRKGKFNTPYDVVSVNGELYVSDYDNHQIQVFEKEGLNFVRLFKAKNRPTQKLCRVCGISVSPDGLLYVACSDASCVLVFTLSGEVVASLGKVHKPRGVVVDSDGFAYVSSGSGAISVF